MIKPDAVENGHIGAILAKINEAGFRIVSMKMTQLSRRDAGNFYAVHKERPFYASLVQFMTSGPVIAAALEHPDAVAYLREVMGATNSAEAADGTVRALYGTNIERNAIHGSDSPENAAIELAFFFSRAEVLAAR